MAACSSTAVSKKSPSSTTKAILRIPHKHIHKLEDIGIGKFGRVSKARISSTDLYEFPHPVAIKRIDDPERNDPKEKRIRFFHEALNLNRFSHPNIVRLLAISIDGPERLMVLEYMDCGSVDAFLRKYWRAISVEKLLNICSQIASGVAHLASNDFIHGDLAARNVLINSKFNVKLGDFGLSQNVNISQHHRLKIGDMPPTPWLPPECYFGNKDSYTKQSDVWSFGVVVWEVFSFGQRPYEDESSDMIMHSVLSGERMDRPVLCPPVVMMLLHSCWRIIPDDRITMEKLSDQLSCLERFFAFMGNIFDDSEN